MFNHGKCVNEPARYLTWGDVGKFALDLYGASLAHFVLSEHTLVLMLV